MHPYRWLCGADAGTYLCQAFAPEHVAEWAGAGIGVLALIGIAAGWVLTRRTLTEMQNHTRTLRAQMILTDRAWLKVSAQIAGGIKRRPHVDEDVVSVTIHIVAENVGRSAAIAVDGFAQVYPTPVRGIILHEQTANWRRIVEETKTGSRESDKDLQMTRTVFPGDTTTIEWTAALSMRDIEARQYAPAGNDRKPSVSLYVVGCVSYELANDSNRRVSSFAYGMMRLKTDGTDGRTESTAFPLDELERGCEVRLAAIPRLFTAD
jgi:hypothetical protein